VGERSADNVYSIKSRLSLGADDGNKIMIKRVLILFLLCCGSLWAQTADPQVINAAGSTRTTSDGDISITDNVGEPFSQTLEAGSLMFTQGYLQPFVVVPGFSVSIQKSDLSCSDKKDGRVTITISTVYQQHTETYSWTPASACPANNCPVIDSLNPGTYSVAIHITYTTTAGVVKQDSSFKSAIVADPVGPCRVDIHTGLTPNGDGVNDNWIIGNITAFDKNKVSIFNRWGNEVYSATGYDNKSKVWPQPGDKLITGTYFYIIDLGDGSKPIKGWVELIKN
jgi:gliding motility-associated-like protein